MLIDSLPERPIKRNEVERLEQSDRIVGVYPVFDSELQKMCFGFVVATLSKASAIAYSPNGWELVENMEIDADADGVHVDDWNKIDELQQSVADHL